MLLPYVNTVYQFRFTSGFAACDGIYKVLRVMTFDEMISDSINLVDLYTKVGKLEEDYHKDAASLRTDKILKLEDVTNSENVLYIPNSFNLYEPNPDVQVYANLVLAVNLGMFDDPTQIEFAKNTIESIIDKGIGIKESTLLFSTKDVWMTVSDYKEHVRQRNARKAGLVNLYSETHKLRKALDEANKKIQYYEDKFIALGNQSLNNDPKE